MNLEKHIMLIEDDNFFALPTNAHIYITILPYVQTLR